MILLKLKGGLGNQLFQYACGRALSLRSGQKLVLDVTGYAVQPGAETPRHFALSPFSIQADEIITDPNDSRLSHLSGVSRKFALSILFTKILRKISGNYHIGWDARFFEKINAEAKSVAKTATEKDVYLDGFWWSEKYFADQAIVIRQDFMLRDPMSPTAQNIASIIDDQSGIPVSIHIRRGDYVLDPKTNAYHGLCSKDYYDEAIAHLVSKIGKNIELFVFSDDIEWVKTNMPFGYPTFYVSRLGPDEKNILADHEELILMSRCRHHIIANSSFSWWGAWLNPSPNKIVIAPARWTKKKIRDSKNMLPDSWITI